MTWLKDEAEVDEMIEQMKSRTKGKHITQGVSFNKECPRQMELLKIALMNSVSFSGLIKELLAQKYTTGGSNKDNSYSFSDTRYEAQPKREDVEVTKTPKKPKEVENKVNTNNTVDKSELDEIKDSNLSGFI